MDRENRQQQTHDQAEVTLSNQIQLLYFISSFFSLVSLVSATPASQINVNVCASRPGFLLRRRYPHRQFSPVDQTTGPPVSGPRPYLQPEVLPPVTRLSSSEHLPAVLGGYG